MLEELRIRDLGVIDDAVLELGPGLVAVTGETGAGKTMVLTGLGLLLGGRADATRVRAGAPRAVVEGRLRLPLDSPAVARAVDAGAQLDDDALLVVRSVTSEGRSRAHLGGCAVPVAMLGHLADDLVAVHGQSDQQRLLRPSMQRAALDRFAGAAVSTPLAGYASAYSRFQEVTSRLNGLHAQARERIREADLLRHGLADIDAAAPEPDESERLAADVERLAHAEALGRAAATAHAALVGDPAAGSDSPDAAGLLAAALRAATAGASHDPQLAQLADRVAQAGYLVADVAADLAAYSTSVDTDPARLAAMQERQAVLTGLTRKYADTLPAVLEWAAQARARLQELDGDDDLRTRLEAQRTELQAQLERTAALVSEARRGAAEAFSAAVGRELAELAMPHAVVSVAVGHTPVDDDRPGLVVNGRRLAFGPDGVDDVELLLAPHPGAPPRPLGRGASGGELSRVMLAVEVVFAGADPVPTLVFDEVDAGVGGRAADEVGRRLARLARDHQVLVVTHLPQVAAYADRHLRVVKDDRGSVTRSGIMALDRAGRVEELSRMLAGREDSPLARAHAEELLATAADVRAAAGAPKPGAARRRRSA